MDEKRRNFIAATGVLSAWGAAAASGPQGAFAAPASMPISAFGLDATQFGVRPGSPDDQSAALQRAIERAAGNRVPLALPPGVYRAGALRLPSGSHLLGVRGATRLVFTGGPSLVSAFHAEHVALTGLTLDGDGRPLPPNQGLVHIELTTDMRVADCSIVASGRHGIRLAAAAGEVTRSLISRAADMAVLSSDAGGLAISGNFISESGNAGIVVIRSERGPDGTLVTDNRIEDTHNRDGGSGQFGNAINAFRADDVIIRNNVIRRCAFSGVRGNSASAIQIIGNVVRDAGEVALYSEFAFEGAIVANNIVDGAVTGLSIANFNEGGRLATVHGNIFRNLAPRHPDADADGLPGTGIYVEADTAVTGNVVENAHTAGIAIGWGPYLRDVAVTGNVIRRAPIAVAVSVVPGAGPALIATNIVTDFVRGAIIGMDHARPVTTELAGDGARRYAHLSITGNRLG